MAKAKDIKGNDGRFVYHPTKEKIPGLRGESKRVDKAIIDAYNKKNGK